MGGIRLTKDGIRFLNGIIREEYRHNPEELRRLCRALDEIIPRSDGRSHEWGLDNEILPYQAELFGEAVEGRDHGGIKDD
jgi:hypothetical protein